VGDKIFEQCPRYLKCSVNNCPLSIDYPNLSVAPNDPEKKCGVAKTIRVRIGSQTTLKYGGLTRGEYNAKERWDALPETEKEAMRQRMIKMREKAQTFK